ncbi:adenylate/guanylate cyclase domain-containing protein, partial [Candidatus Riflebacteria bacterium]
MGYIKRSLKAILFSDIKSFSAMMAADEHRTFELVKEHRQIFRSYLKKYGGQEKGTGGDSFFVLFDSAMDAVYCSMEIQKAFHQRNYKIPKSEQVWIRIGLHLGDIILDPGENDVFGDSVNIAARAEPKAEPGGICVTKSIHVHVEKKVDFEFVSIGILEMKNIADAPELFKIPIETILSFEDLEEEEGMVDGAEISERISTVPEKNKYFYFIAILSGILLIAFFTFMSPSEIKKEPSPKKEVNLEKIIGRSRALVVFPFENITRNVGDDWLSTGLAETIEAKLSGISDLKVFSRSLFLKRKETGDIAAKALALGIKLGVKGSFQKIGKQIRIVGKLVDFSEGSKVLYAKEEKGDFADIFSLQDELALEIAAKLGEQLKEDDKQKIKDKGTRNIAALEQYAKGLTFLNSGNRIQALKYLNRASSLDPKFKKAKRALNKVFASSEYFRFHADGRTTSLNLQFIPSWDGGSSFQLDNSRKKIVKAWDWEGNPLSVTARRVKTNSWQSIIKFPVPPPKGLPLEFTFEVEFLDRIMEEQGVFARWTAGIFSEKFMQKTFILEIPENAIVLAFRPIPFEILRQNKRRLYVFHVARDKFQKSFWKLCYTFSLSMAEKIRNMSLAERKDFLQKSLLVSQSPPAAFFDFFHTYELIKEEKFFAAG